MDIVTIDGIPVYQALVDSEDAGMMRISLVDDPAVQSNFLKFKKDTPARTQMYAVQDEERHLVLGVVMRADFPIYRRDEQVGEYYIIYKAATIREMAEKYLAENRQNDVNLMHEEGSDVDGVQMVQYFIKNTALGIVPDGFTDIADGSLFAEFHVTNEEVWAAIKDGTYKGFSLEGIFNLQPESNADEVQAIVDALQGAFARIIPKNKFIMTKVKGLLARLAKALVEMGNITTDKGILTWDGEDDLKAGDSVFIENADGEREPAADGEYVTADNKTIVVADGKVSEIRDPQAEIAPAEGEGETFASKATDKGTLEWEGDEDLKSGDNVFITDADGNTEPAPDGDYKTEDGKTITVVDGKVVSITDPAAQVAPVDARKQRFARIKAAFAESYEDKERKIVEAIAALGITDFWLVEAGEDFAIAEVWKGEGYGYTRFAISWDAEGNAIATNPEEVVPAYVTEAEKAAAESAPSAEEVETLRNENTQLKAQIQKMSETPAAPAAHTAEVQSSGMPAKTGNKGLDRLAELMSKK